MADISARECAVRILVNIAKNQAYSNIAIDSALKEFDFDQRDKALVTTLVYGTVQHLYFLDFQIQRVSKIKINKMDDFVRETLRTAVYQIFCLEKIPESAAVNEAVKIIKKHCKSASGFVNALLRKIIASGIKLPDEKNKTEYLSVKYSYPLWMVKRWMAELGDEECEELLKAGNQNPAVTIRVNRLKTSEAALSDKIQLRKTKLPFAMEVLEKGSLADGEEFKNGLFSIQDMASQMAADALSPKEGETVLDVCAAPGGKTTCIAEIMQNKGKVFAWDIYPSKIKIIEKAAKRLGITIIEAAVHNAKEPALELFKKCDRVLVDAPCSGLGIIRKKPDIKWNRKEEDIAELVKEQICILETSAAYVKNGGTLVYSTCTVTYEENEGIVQRFLENNKDFELVKPSLTLYPHKDGTDGFFISVMQRREKLEHTGQNF